MAINGNVNNEVTLIQAALAKLDKDDPTSADQKALLTKRLDQLNSLRPNPDSNPANPEEDGAQRLEQEQSKLSSLPQSLNPPASSGDPYATSADPHQMEIRYTSAIGTTSQVADNVLNIGSLFPGLMDSVRKIYFKAKTLEGIFREAFNFAVQQHNADKDKTAKDAKHALPAQ